MSRISPRARRSEGPWLSVSAAARALGVSPSTLRLWASEGRVPHVRTAGGHRRFDPEALRQWLARQPARATRTPRQGIVRIPVEPELAEALRARVDRVSEAVETLVEGPAEAAYRRLPPMERRNVVGAWVEALADAFETGSLADALERSETYGRGHGLAGSSAEVTLGGSLALERGDRSGARRAARSGHRVAAARGGRRHEPAHRARGHRLGRGRRRPRRAPAGLSLTPPGRGSSPAR